MAGRLWRRKHEEKQQTVSKKTVLEIHEKTHEEIHAEIHAEIHEEIHEDLVNNGQQSAKFLVETKQHQSP
jgi:hypothetical protein